MKRASIHAVASQLQSRFHVDMELWDVLSNSAYALEELGMLVLDRVVERYTVSNYVVQLPAAARKPFWCVYLTPTIFSPNQIEIQEVYQPVQLIFKADEPQTVADESKLVANYIGKIKGPWVDFSWECPYLKFNETDFDIAVMYSKLAFDDDGYPYVPEAAMEALVQYCHMIYQQPLYVLGRLSPQVWQSIERWVQQAFARATQKQIFYGLSRNELSHILDVMSSFDRKQYGIDA